MDNHRVHRHRRHLRRLDSGHAPPPAVGAAAACARGAPRTGTDGLPNSAVRCSVIVAARDEETRLEATVRHLLAQQHVALEVIVVDDRSTDATGDILRRLALEDARVHAIRVEQLPEGWLGKCHACHVGASAATGDWLLFTDADCWLKPDVIARALRVADRDDADHITLTPGVTAETLGAQAWHLAFLGRLANWISGVNRDRPGAHLGIGAFNLVRTSAYRACGGYEALRMTIVDDIKLGLLLHRAGRRTRAFIGGSDAECHWGTTVPRMIKIMEKNYFAALDFRLAPVVAGATVFSLIFGMSIIGLWTRPPPESRRGSRRGRWPSQPRSSRGDWDGLLPARPSHRFVPGPVLRGRELGRRHASTGRRPVARYVLFARHLAQG